MRTDSQPPPSFAGRRVHFIGIAGAGMSGLARILLDSGATVTGSDRAPNEQTDALAARGATIRFQQRGELLAGDTALVVRTAAVRDDNPEFELARELGIPTMKYAELLGRVMGERFGVAVAGTHGKSTTTAMLCHALVQCGADPSFVVGGHVPQLGGGSRSGAGPHFVAEACEYDRSFLHLRPCLVVLNNIEAEHLDCYGSLDAIVAAFRELALRVPDDGGLVVARGDDRNVRRVIDGLSRPVQTFGFSPEFDWHAGVDRVVAGCHHGDVFRRGERVATLRPSIPGEHNLLNATCALACAAACGLDPARAADAISSFAGVDRRMTEMGRLPGSGAVVVDDYGHHPTEVRVTLDALRQKYSPRRLICVFQPHQYSRTRLLLDDFATSFAAADETIVPEIYAVRDSAADKLAVSSRVLVDRITAGGGRAVHVSTFPDVVRKVRGEARDGDVIVTMGAGNVYEVARELVRSI